MTDWQPIKDAPPRDGQLLLGFSSENGAYFGFNWAEGVYGTHEGWTYWPLTDFSDQPPEGGLTHWAYFPAPTTGESKARKVKLQGPLQALIKIRDGRENILEPRGADIPEHLEEYIKSLEALIDIAFKAVAALDV